MNICLLKRKKEGKQTLKKNNKKLKIQFFDECYKVDLEQHEMSQLLRF